MERDECTGKQHVFLKAFEMRKKGSLHIGKKDNLRKSACVNALILLVCRVTLGISCLS